MRSDTKTTTLTRKSPSAIQMGLKLMVQPNTRVLLLEDNAVLAESIAFALGTFNLEVVGPFETNELSGLELTREHMQVGVLDLELAAGTSIPTAVRLREAGIPFLFMSGHDIAAELPEEFQNEICLPKPVPADVLFEAIMELCES